MAELCSESAVDKSMALQIVEEGFEHVKRANAGADPLPYGQPDRKISAFF